MSNLPHSAPDSPAIRWPKAIHALAALILTVIGSSCSQKHQLNLMPTPLIHQYLGAQAYRTLDSDERSQRMQIFYATNRPGSGPEATREYGNGIEDTLHLGTASMRLGERGTDWREVLAFSIEDDREEKVHVHLESANELSREKFSEAVDTVLAEERRPDITIYVHGAKSSFFRSTTQGAQFHHFMARQTAMVAYSWPSTGSFLTYQKDVDFAAQSAGNLADLIEYLAENTNARKINLLVYSAGGQVAGPGLAQLRQRYPESSDAALKRRFRLGEIYFAAADVSLAKFVDEYLPTFAGIVENVTVTYHRRDSILKIAQHSHDGEARLGRPVREQITAAQIDRLEELAKQGKLDAIDMEYSTVERPVDFRAHGHWYLNEWVSSDAIVQFLQNQSPSKRGLERKPGSEAWYFPPDYPERLRILIDQARAAEAASNSS